MQSQELLLISKPSSLTSLPRKSDNWIFNCLDFIHEQIKKKNQQNQNKTNKQNSKSSPLLFCKRHEYLKLIV